MGTIISNGSLMYRYGSPALILRTPIHIKLKPDQRAVYQVCGRYSKQGNVWWPNGGFIAKNPNTGDVRQVGADCVSAALHPADQRQTWRSVTSTHDPETCWYQGAYATSANNAQEATTSAEAYYQLGSYHFTVPNGLQGLSVTGVKVSFTNGGCIQCYRSAGGKSANNKTLKGYGSFRDWWMPIVVSNVLPTQANWRNYAWDEPVDLMADTGVYKGVRDLWAFTGTTRDGGIPVLTVPKTHSYFLGQATLNSFNQNKGGWITPVEPLSYSSTSSYLPYYVNSTNGYWACMSVWGFSVELDLE